MSLEKIVASLVEKVERRFYGKYRGFVVENADPENLGRLKLRVPSVLGDEVVTGWAMPCVPYGGDANQGMLFIPEVDAGVWVEFEEGDLEFPIWVGTFWSKPGGESELPLPNQPDGSEESAVQDPPTRKIIKTLKGHTIQFEDKDDEEMITIVEGGKGHIITMNKDGIIITEGANKHKVLLDSTGITITDGKNNGNEILMTSTGVKVKTSGTEIMLGATGVQVGGTGATEPFVLGNQFMSQVTSFLLSLSTHTHVGNLGAPTSPPTTPINLQVPLSTKHKVE
jgi:uncharacterized protein involved in type VI secretion and phage assembly